MDIEGIMPNTWEDIKERRRFLDIYQRVCTQLKNESRIAMKFRATGGRRLDRDVLGFYLGQKHHDLTKDIRKLRKAGDNEKISNKSERKEILKRVKFLKKLITSRNLLSIGAWTIVFSLIVIGSMFTISIGLGGLI